MLVFKQVNHPPPFFSLLVFLMNRKKQLEAMTIELMALHARRKAFFLEDLRNRRIQTRGDVYMEALKKFANKQVYDLEDSDVLNL